MNQFKKHPQQQGITYQEHMLFAMGIALRLFNSVIAFALHAIFPFIGIKRTLDLEQTASFIQERNEWIENMKQEKQSAPAETATQSDVEENFHLISSNTSTRFLLVWPFALFLWIDASLAQTDKLAEETSPPIAPWRTGVPP